MNLVALHRIAGAAVHYARQPVAPYGSQGLPRTVRLDRAFRDTLEAALEDLWRVCRMGRADVVVSGGCYVEKAGRHGEGVAVDIDAIWWKGRPPLIARNAPKDAARYLGVEAVLRRHIGTVLDYWYNGAHEDHWHCDAGSAPGWREGSRARVVFMQAALSLVHGQDIGPAGIDGILGRSTRAALARALGEREALNPGALWPALLEATIAKAFTL